MSACPLCGDRDGRVTVIRDRLPTMQNYVHRTREHAVAAAQGRLDLSVCRVCGFARNAAFDPSRLEYDDAYDNNVPSPVMAEYYDDIARYLGVKYDLARGYVVDIGCGDGKFLKALARVWPDCRALGVDPALRRDETHAGGRIRLVKGVFSDALLEQPPSLFVSRHVLEHMPDPVSFVGELRKAIGDRNGVPLFVEVPDVGWIVDHAAFWDFCYEHCNYFGEASLAAALAAAGFTPTATRLAFGGQYRWMEAVSGPAQGAPDSAGAAAVAVAARLRDYAAGERHAVDATRRTLAAAKASGTAVVVWGMATKGIMFSLLVDPDSTLIDRTVDVNTNKQGCFVPLSGRSIEAPEALRSAAGRLTVVVMNTNYLSEIRETCRSLGVSADFVDAAGAEARAT